MVPSSSVIYGVYLRLWFLLSLFHFFDLISLLLDFAHDCFIHLFLHRIHFLILLLLLLFDLVFQEILSLQIDLLDFFLDTLVLFFP